MSQIADWMRLQLEGWRVVLYTGTASCGDERWLGEFLMSLGQQAYMVRPHTHYAVGSRYRGCHARTEYIECGDEGMEGNSELLSRSAVVLIASPDDLPGVYGEAPADEQTGGLEEREERRINVHFNSAYLKSVYDENSGLDRGLPIYYFAPLHILLRDLRPYLGIGEIVNRLERLEWDVPYGEGMGECTDSPYKGELPYEYQGHLNRWYLFRMESPRDNRRRHMRVWTWQPLDREANMADMTDSGWAVDYIELLELHKLRPNGFSPNWLYARDEERIILQRWKASGLRRVYGETEEGSDTFFMAMVRLGDEAQDIANGGERKGVRPLTVMANSINGYGRGLTGFPMVLDLERLYPAYDARNLDQSRSLSAYRYREEQGVAAPDGWLTRDGKAHHNSYAGHAERLFTLGLNHDEAYAIGLVRFTKATSSVISLCPREVHGELLNLMDGALIDGIPGSPITWDQYHTLESICVRNRMMSTWELCKQCGHLFDREEKFHNGWCRSLQRQRQRHQKQKVA